MRVFEIWADVHNYASLDYAGPPSGKVPARDLSALERIRLNPLRFDGTSRAGDWQPPPVRTSDTRQPRPDILSISPGGTPVFSGRSLEVLGPVIEDAGELLPVDFDGETVFVLNVMPVREGLLDPEKALLAPPEKQHVVFGPYRYAFLTDRVPEAAIFRIPESRLRLLCGEDVSGRPGFRRSVEEAGLTGLFFKLVWDPDLAEPEQECRQRIIQLLRDHPGEFTPPKLLAAAGVDPPPTWCSPVSWNDENGLIRRVYGEVCKVPGVERVGEGMALRGAVHPPPPLPPVDPTPPALRREGDLVALLQELGCHDAHGWGESEEREGLPQVAIYTFLRTLWPNLIDPWRQDHGWLDRMPVTAVARLREAGTSPEDLGNLAAAIAYSVVFDLLMHLDQEGDPTAPDDAPRWRLEETDPSGQPTGRTLSGCLHELLLELDPSGRHGHGLFG